MAGKTWHQKHLESRSEGAQLADKVARAMGSWTFIAVQTCLILAWGMLNVLAWAYRWDPYPFILLNLLFSLQAAYAAPIIMQSQNRQAERDRVQAEADYETNVQAKAEIEDLQARLARIENEKLDKILALLENRG